MRVTQQFAYVIHTRAFSETSLIVELFSQSHGRLAVLAKGARRAKSPLRGVLQAFQPLIVGWSGKGEMPVMIQAESNSRYHWLDYKSRVCGFYANELIMNFLQRRDPHQQLFKDYDMLMQCLSVNTTRELALRRFEKALLQEIGYGLILTHEVEHQRAVEDAKMYRYIPESGPIIEAQRGADVGHMPSSPLIVSGRVLNSIALDDYPNDAVMLDAKHFIRRILQMLMTGKSLHSRNLLYYTANS